MEGMIGRVGKYSLVERLGVGGMAEVFKAQLVGPGGFVKNLAIKMILSHISDDPEFVQMFTQEATLAAKLDHNNIVRIYEFDHHQDRYYIAMELVEGSDMRKILMRCQKTSRPLTTQEALLIALEICKGIAFAHGELDPNVPPIIHRDVSPHNVILSRSGEVKITDFGIAKLASSLNTTQPGRIKGKFSYMSPEQSRGENLTKQSDIFSLGIILWELLTTRKLFPQGSDAKTLEQVQSATIKPPSTVNPAVPAEVDQISLQALERNLADRIGSATDLGRKLDQALNSFPNLDRATSLSRLHQELFGSPTTAPTKTQPVIPTPAAVTAPDTPNSLRNVMLPDRGPFESIEISLGSFSPLEANRPSEPSPALSLAPGEAVRRANTEALFSRGVARARAPARARSFPAPALSPAHDDHEEHLELVDLNDLGAVLLDDPPETVPAPQGASRLGPSGPLRPSLPPCQTGRSVDREPGTAASSDVPAESGSGPAQRPGARPRARSSRRPAARLAVLLALFLVPAAAALSPSPSSTRARAPARARPFNEGEGAGQAGGWWAKFKEGVTEMSLGSFCFEGGDCGLNLDLGWLLILETLRTGAVCSSTGAPAQVGCNDKPFPSPCANVNDPGLFSPSISPPPTRAPARLRWRAEPLQCARPLPLAPALALPPSGVCEAPARATDPSPPHGRLSINAIPWAVVYLGTKRLGETPIENVRLPAGRHRLRLVNEELGVTKRVWVTVREGLVVTEVVVMSGA